MKKILVLLLAVYLSSVATQAKMPEDCIKNRHPLPPRMTEQERTQRENAFDQRLGLTEEQKQKSKEIRLEGRDKIKPVIDKIKSRESEIELVKKSNLTQSEQEIKLNSLNADLKTLHKQAHDIRVENMKRFEEILTTEQRQILKEMKQEGRQEYNKHRMPPPPRQ